MGPVRKASREDAGRIALMLPFVHDWHAETYPEIFRPWPDLAEVTAHFAAMIADPEVTVLLSGEPPCAYAVCVAQRRSESLFTKTRKRLVVEHIATDPAHRREGHGCALIRAAEALARHLGSDEIVLDTWGRNEGAHAFFRAMGYAPQRSLFQKPV